MATKVRPRIRCECGGVFASDNALAQHQKDSPRHQTSNTVPILVSAAGSHRTNQTSRRSGAFVARSRIPTSSASSSNYDFEDPPPPYSEHDDGERYRGRSDYPPLNSRFYTFSREVNDQRSATRVAARESRDHESVTKNEAATLAAPMTIPLVPVWVFPVPVVDGQMGFHCTQ
ncbi:hypothetical protein F4680DRAFT_399343 [Xylaria scruposa]|nr:hypothetical protein F4680DRAFT_399343 [Xylaria scruposa]